MTLRNLQTLLGNQAVANTNSTYTSPLLSMKSPEDLAREIAVQQQEMLINSYPNHIIVRVEASGDRGGNLYEGEAGDAARQGLIYGNVSRFVKGDLIQFPLGNGGTAIKDLKQICSVRGRFVMKMSPEMAEEFCELFHSMPADRRYGGRRAEVYFAFEETVEVNTGAVIIAQGIWYGDLTAPMGDAIQDEELFDKMYSDNANASREYKRNRRELLSKEAELQLLAAKGVKVEESQEETSTESETEEEYSPDMTA